MSDNKFRKGPQNSAKNRPTRMEDVGSAISSADERNVQVVDEDFEGADFEDKVWLWWIRNRNFVIFTIVAAFVIVVGIQGYKAFSHSQKKAIAASYMNAANADELAAFASQNAGTALAGVALLENADAAYKAGKYAEARELYSSAVKELEKTVLEGRASLGAAVSAYASGDTQAGMDALKAVYEDNSLAYTYKSLAGYLLGMALKQNGKPDEAKAVLKAVSEDPMGGTFASVAQEALSNMD